MNEKQRARLAGHAMVVLLLGLIAGFPWANVINAGLDVEGAAEASRAWRMAHLEGLLNGLLMLGVAGIGPVLMLSEGQVRWLSRLLCLAGYGNIVASILGAATGNRGLQPVGPPANQAVFVLFMSAVAAVFVAVVLVIFGCVRRSQTA